MIIYLVFFAISFLLIYLSEKYKNNKKISYSLEIVAILTLSILAGIRSLDIGTDVKTYVQPAFMHTIVSGLDNYFTSQIEIGYMILNYLVSLFTHRISILLFVIQFIIIFFSYQGIKKICKDNSNMGFMIFIILFYNMSLNIVRQFLALAFLLYSFKFLYQKKYLITILIIILSSLFHKSAIIFLAVPLLYKFAEKIKKRDIPSFVIAIATGLLTILLFDNLLSLFVKIGFLPEKYLFYQDHYVNATLNFQFIFIMVDLVIILLYLFQRNKKLNKENESTLFYYFALIDILFLIVGARYDVINRVGLYFRVPAYVYYLSKIDLFFTSQKNKKLVNYCVIAICLLIWCYIYILGNAGATYPYQMTNDSIIAKILR